ncbi:unnamed protein product [Calypogeia fissa]
MGLRASPLASITWVPCGHSSSLGPASLHSGPLAPASHHKLYRRAGWVGLVGQVGQYRRAQEAVAGRERCVAKGRAGAGQSTRACLGE